MASLVHHLSASLAISHEEFCAFGDFGSRAPSVEAVILAYWLDVGIDVSIALIFPNRLLIKVRSLSDYVTLQRHRYLVVESMFLEVSCVPFACLDFGGGRRVSSISLPPCGPRRPSPSSYKRSYADVVAKSEAMPLVNSLPLSNVGCSKGYRGIASQFAKQNVAASCFASVAASCFASVALPTIRPRCFRSRYSIAVDA